MREKELANEGMVFDVRAINKVRRNEKIIVCDISWCYHPAETLLYIKKTKEGLMITKKAVTNAAFFKVTRKKTQSHLNLMPFKDYLEDIPKVSIKRVEENYYLMPATEDEIDELAICHHTPGYVGINFGINITKVFTNKIKKEFLNPILLVKRVKNLKTDYIKIFAIEEKNRNQYSDCKEIQGSLLYLPIEFIKEYNIYPKDMLKVEFIKNSMIIKPKEQKCDICDSRIDPYSTVPLEMNISPFTKNIIEKEVKPNLKANKTLIEIKKELVEKETKIKQSFDIIEAEIIKIREEIKI